MAGLVNCEDLESQQCLADFVERLQKYMSVSCSIPFQVPASNLAEIVRNAKTLFHRMYEDAVEETYLALPEEEIQKRLFTKGIVNAIDNNHQPINSSIRDSRGTFTLPEGVISVIGVYEIGGFSGEAGWNSGLLGKATGDISMQRMIYQSVYDRALAVSADNTMYYVCTEAFLDLSRQLFQEQITYKYNRLTRKVRFLGELPKHDVILNCLVAIPDCDLFEDDLFFRYCVAEAKIQLSRVLGSFAFNLPGNVSINVDMIANDGQTEKSEILEEIKMMSSAGYIYTS